MFDRYLTGHKGGALAYRRFSFPCFPVFYSVVLWF